MVIIHRRANEQCLELPFGLLRLVGHCGNGRVERKISRLHKSVQQHTPAERKEKLTVEKEGTRVEHDLVVALAEDGRNVSLWEKQGRSVANRVSRVNGITGRTQSSRGVSSCGDSKRTQEEETHSSLESSKREETLVGLDGVSDELCRLCLSLRADDDRLLLLDGLVDEEGRSLSGLLGDLLGCGQWEERVVSLSILLSGTSQR